MKIKTWKLPIFAAVTVAVVSVAGCSNVWEGMKRDYRAIERQTISYPHINRERGIEKPKSHKIWYDEETHPKNWPGEGQVVLKKPGTEAVATDKPGVTESEPYRPMMVQRIVVDDDGRVRVVEHHPTPPKKPKEDMGASAPDSSAPIPITVFKVTDEPTSRPVAVQRMAPIAAAEPPPPSFEPVRQFKIVEPAQTLEPVRRRPPPRREPVSSKTSPELAASYGVLSNQNVTVFPIEEDYSDYDPSYLYEEGPEYGVVSSSGTYYPSATRAGSGSATIYFNHNSTRLGSIDKKKIQGIAQQGGSYRVVGHASERAAPNLDSVQKRVVNLEISMKRAAAVSGELYKSGVTPDWVETVARGDSELTGQEKTDRRVEIYLENR